MGLIEMNYYYVDSIFPNCNIPNRSGDGGLTDILPTIYGEIKNKPILFGLHHHCYRSSA